MDLYEPSWYLGSILYMTVAIDEIKMIEPSHTDKWLLLEAGGGLSHNRTLRAWEQ